VTRIIEAPRSDRLKRMLPRSAQSGQKDPVRLSARQQAVLHQTIEHVAKHKRLRLFRIWLSDQRFRHACTHHRVALQLTSRPWPLQREVAGNRERGRIILEPVLV
jgi:hypothetical protein